jgi:hypothetical protein
MEKVIHLLKERNKYLSKFSALNAAECGRMSEGNFERIDEFYTAREGILEIIKQLELMMEKFLSSDGGATQIAPSLKRMAGALLKERDELVNQILGQDLEILQLIDQAKNDIIHQLQGLKKGRKVISSYKSGTKAPTLDEEA